MIYTPLSSWLQAVEADGQNMVSNMGDGNVPLQVWDRSMELNNPEDPWSTATSSSDQEELVEVVWVPQVGVPLDPGADPGLTGVVFSHSWLAENHRMDRLQI